MTVPNIMPTSTTPITFARLLNAALLGATALSALCVLAYAAADYTAIEAGETGSERLAQAAALPPGRERDVALDAAQRALQQALERRRADAQLWSRLAETRLLQATGAAVSEVSPELVAAAVDAGARVERLDRASAADHARQAYALALLPGRAQEAAQALARSYAMEPLGTGLSERRLSTALLVWAGLEGSTREQAVAEACAHLADPTADQVTALALLRAPRPTPADCPRAPL